MLKVKTKQKGGSRIHGDSGSNILFENVHFTSLEIELFFPDVKLISEKNLMKDPEMLNIDR